MEIVIMYSVRDSAPRTDSAQDNRQKNCICVMHAVMLNAITRIHDHIATISDHFLNCLVVLFIILLYLYWNPIFKMYDSLVTTACKLSGGIKILFNKWSVNKYINAL